MNPGLDARESTRALRDGSSSALRFALERWLAVSGRDRDGDQRDAMIGLAPFVDCARRIGQDPGDLLGPVVASCPPWLRQAFAATIGYPDVTLEALGWTVVNTDDGPAYRFAWPE